ncbi:MAG: hypothetical protein R2716_13410 [Microthrixaceae bacterium]
MIAPSEPIVVVEGPGESPEDWINDGAASRSSSGGAEQGRR